MSVNYVDGKRYLVTFNNWRDCVEATWIKNFRLFSHIAGSISIEDVNSVEEIK